MPMVDFESMTSEEAAAFLALTEQRQDTALSELRKCMQDDGAPPVHEAHEVAGLVEVWSWFVGWHDRGFPYQGEAQAPPWYVPLPNDGFLLGVPALEAVDRIGYQLAAVVLREIPEARWHVARRPKRDRYAFQNMPAIDIRGTDLVPSWPVRALAVRLVRGTGGRDPEELLAIYRQYEAAE